MSARPRGSCPACWTDRALTPSGRIWAHRHVNVFGHIVETVCRGTGRLPVGADR